MKLFLIRHGETVDNLAGLYAGTLDSKLTNHGVKQTQRLGEYLAKQDVRFTHIFASPLSRAFMTAEAIFRAQDRSVHVKDGSKGLEIVKTQELIERDFGYYEGKPFSARADPKSPEGEKHNSHHRDQPGFVDIESEQSMATRIDSFLNQHLLPLFDRDGQHGEVAVAIVAHGMLLSHFWRRLLLRLPRKSLTIASEVTEGRSVNTLEHIGGWSNTGYLELSIQGDLVPENNPTPAHPAEDGPQTSEDADTLPTPAPPPLEPEDAQVSVAPSSDHEVVLSGKTSPRNLTGWSTIVLAIDSKEHLIGLKRQRGGIGSIAHDENQKKLDSFFKRPKLT